MSNKDNNTIALTSAGTGSGGKRLYLKTNEYNASTLPNAMKDNVVYWILATPLDVLITDTNLIEQLEEVDKAQSYRGTTIVTSTNENTNSQMYFSAIALKGE